MKWLACFEIGFEGFFVVEIDDWKDVSQLKEMIKDIILYSFPAEHLKLYVAKKGDRWLQSNDPSIKQLEKGYFPADIKDVIKQNGEMDANYSMLNEAFGFPDVGDADEEDVHVLVDMPEYAKKDLLFFRYNYLAQDVPMIQDSGFLPASAWDWLASCFSSSMKASPTKKNA
ncbi:unnamed protein product [Aphanomyces euteiches]